MGKREIWWIVGILVVMAAVGFSCDRGGGDDDDDNDNDNDDTTPAGSWPGNPAPVTGWFASRVGGNMIDVYRYEAGEFETFEPGEMGLFDEGYLSGPDDGWAASYHSIYQLRNGKWHSFDEPTCEQFADQVYFGRNEIALLCLEPYRKHIYRGDAGWSEEEMEPLYNHMHCLDLKHCAFWSDNDAKICVGGNCEKLEWPSRVDKYQQFVWRDENTVLALANDTTSSTDDGEAIRLLRRDLENDEWVEDDRCWGTYSAKLQPMGGKYVACRTNDTVVLDGDDGTIEPGWPDFDYLSMAPGGGGLAYYGEENRIYLIEGLVATPIFKFSGHEWASFLVAADAE